MNIADCLANTGGSAQTALLLVAVSVVLLGLGLLALRGRKHKKAVLGALAIVGALTLVPLASPSSAQAATGGCTPAASQPAVNGSADAGAGADPANPTDPAPSPGTDPTPESNVTYVAPEAPTTAPMCGVAPVITTPESEYFSYETAQNGTSATVTASLKPGLADIAVQPGAQTTWVFDVSFDPATVLTPESFAFTYDGSSPDPRISDAAVAEFLEAQGAPLEFKTVSEVNYTYAVFDFEGNQITALGDTTQLTRYQTDYSAVQSGQDVELTYTGSSEVDGYEKAVAYFEAQGGLPEGTSIGIRSSSAYENTALLTASYVNECGVAGSVTATTPFEIIPA